MIESLINKKIGDSEKKKFRQVKIVQGEGKDKTKFVADIPEGSNEVEKIDELFEKILKQMQKMKFYEENK